MVGFIVKTGYEIDWEWVGVMVSEIELLCGLEGIKLLQIRKLSTIQVVKNKKEFFVTLGYR